MSSPSTSPILCAEGRLEQKMGQTGAKILWAFPGARWALERHERRGTFHVWPLRAGALGTERYRIGAKMLWAFPDARWALGRHERRGTFHVRPLALRFGIRQFFRKRSPFLRLASRQ